MTKKIAKMLIRFNATVLLLTAVFAIFHVMSAPASPSSFSSSSSLSSSSSSSSSSSRKKQSSRFYFSDVEKYIETKTNGLNRISNDRVNSVPFSSQSSSSLSSSARNGKPNRPAKYKSNTFLNDSITAWLDRNEAAATIGDVESDSSTPTRAPYRNHFKSSNVPIVAAVGPSRTRAGCRAHVKMFKLNVSNSCEPLDFRTVECSGFCSSRTMLWKNMYETSNMACCSIIKMYQQEAKLYCLAPVEFNVLVEQAFRSWSRVSSSSSSSTSSSSSSFSNAYLYDLFRENFVMPNWTHSYMLIGDRLYSGYYSIQMTRNATCRCQSLN